MWFFKVYVHGCGFLFFFLKKEKTLFWGLGDPQKKVIVLLTLLIFQRLPILDKDKTFVSCWNFGCEGHEGRRNFHYEGICFKVHQVSIKPLQWYFLRAFNTFFKGFDPRKKLTLL